MIKLKIDVKKIAKEHLFAGAKCTYLDLTLLDNRDGEDQYGNAGFIVQEVTKEKREAGIKGPIIGNWRHVGNGAPAGGNRNPMGGQDRTAAEATRRPVGQQVATQEDDDSDDSDVPF